MKITKDGVIKQINFETRISDAMKQLVDEPLFVDHVGFIIDAELNDLSPIQVQVRITRKQDDFDNTKFYLMDRDRKEEKNNSIKKMKDDRKIKNEDKIEKAKQMGLI